MSLLASIRRPFSGPSRHQPRLVDVVYENTSSFKKLTFFFLWSWKLFFSKSAIQVVHKVPGHAYITYLHLRCFVAFHSGCVLCIVSTISITLILQCLSHAVFTEIVSAYEHSSPDRESFNGLAKNSKQNSFLDKLRTFTKKFISLPFASMVNMLLQYVY